MVATPCSLAGDVALDFVNTVEGIRSAAYEETLGAYEDLLRWAEEADIISRRERSSLSRLAVAHPLLAQRALSDAIAMREALHGVLQARLTGAAPKSAELGRLNAMMAAAMSKARLAVSEDRYSWTWSEELVLERPTWPIARAAAELLTSRRLARLRECASETCGWLFLDQSKNRSRRWCDMRGCGNRTKIRRYRARIAREKS